MPSQRLSAHSLLAVIPPGSVEAEVAGLQNAIFSTHGCLSSIALPPLIPVAFISEDSPPGIVTSICRAACEARRAARPAFRFRSAGLAWVDGWLFLRLDSGGAWDALHGEAEAPSRLAAAHEPAVPARGLFPVREGFLLGCGELDEERRAGLALDAPPLSFSSCFLARVSLRVSADDGRWWREVYLEIQEKKPLR
jgi:hypothetical protein